MTSGSSSAASDLGVQSSDVSLTFDDSEIVVNPGERLDLNCGFKGEYRYCIWEVEGAKPIQVEDVYGNFHPGMSKPEVSEGNECGIVINSVSTEQHGMWTCRVFITGNSLEGTKNVIVTVKPTYPVLEVDNSQLLEVTSEEETPVKCVVAAARPAVGIRWFLGDKDVTVMAETEETPTDNEGMYKSISTLRRTFEPMENGMTLTCSVSHKTLTVPENESIPLNVIFKPVEKPVSTYYQIRPGSDYEVKLNFSANPPPIRKEWRYGDSFQNIAVSIEIPGAKDRYETYIEELGNGMYTATLRIAGFKEEDANQRYLLVVENDIGETTYKVRLSMDDAPKDGDSETRDHDKNPSTEYSVSEGIVFDDDTMSNTLSGGAVAGIVIVVLVIVAAVAAAGYARYRQMFCFAPVVTPDPEEGKETKEEHSDTESARGANTTRAANLKNSLGRLTQVFKKPKKEQETKLENIGDDEKRSLTTDDPKKGSPVKEQNVDDKELTGETRIPEEMLPPIQNSEQNNSEVKRELSDEIKVPEDGTPHMVNAEQKPAEKKEVVYAELDLGKSESDKKTEVKAEDKTEYAQIVGTVTDNREDEKKE
ncbi:fasciclin-3 isoform X6 [Penaeus vannamei]|uniref:fasciclin-3 isoform X6 n=1 Tax=Penaeus vannamei TaxID=6689 RepID=UPI00387F3C28